MRFAPEQIAATYEYLLSFKPFSSWGLPPVDEVKFVVNKDGGTRGTWCFRNKHVITISSVCVTHMGTLLRTMAHEMVHAGQYVRGAETKAVHNADFYKQAAVICKRFAWDEGIF